MFSLNFLLKFIKIKKKLARDINVLFSVFELNEKEERGEKERKEEFNTIIKEDKGKQVIESFFFYRLFL